jgi:hypothetical protein
VHWAHGQTTRLAVRWGWEQAGLKTNKSMFMNFDLNQSASHFPVLVHFDPSPSPAIGPDPGPGRGPGHGPGPGPDLGPGPGPGPCPTRTGRLTFSKSRHLTYKSRHSEHIQLESHILMYFRVLTNISIYVDVLVKYFVCSLLHFCICSCRFNISEHFQYLFISVVWCGHISFIPQTGLPEAVLTVCKVMP